MNFDEWSNRKPMKSSIISTGMIMGIGDMITQYLEHIFRKDNQRFKVDIKRLIIISGYGFILSGPLSGWWYNTFLPKIAPINFKLQKKQLVKQLILKVFYDETIFSFITIYSFIFYSTFLDTLNY